MGGSGPCHLIELFRLVRYLIIVKLKLATTLAVNMQKLEWPVVKMNQEK